MDCLRSTSLELPLERVKSWGWAGAGAGVIYLKAHLDTHLASGLGWLGNWNCWMEPCTCPLHVAKFLVLWLPPGYLWDFFFLHGSWGLQALGFWCRGRCCAPQWDFHALSLWKQHRSAQRPGAFVCHVMRKQQRPIPEEHTGWERCCGHLWNLPHSGSFSKND